jgi:hypothetical protein
MHTHHATLSPFGHIRKRYPEGMQQYDLYSLAVCLYPVVTVIQTVLENYWLSIANKSFSTLS